jgi:hypothetical protein
MIDVADLADRRHALDKEKANLTRGHAETRILAFAIHELGRHTCTAHQLSTTAGNHLNIMDS